MIDEVWVCSGQLNIAWWVRRSNKANTEIGAATWRNIRFFRVPGRVTDERETNVDAE